MSRLIITLILCAFIAILVSGGLIDWAFSSFAHQTKNALNGDAQYEQTLANFLDDSEDIEASLLSWNAANASQQQATVGQNSKPSLQILDLEDLPLPSALEAQFVADGVIELQSQERVARYYLLPKQQRILMVEQAEGSQLYASQLVFTLAFYCSIFAALTLWLYPLLIDLKRLRTATQAFGMGDLNVRIRSPRWSYTQDIHAAFNTMASKIERLVSDNKLLSNALSHELKTPLARLRFGFDVLSEEQDADKKQNYIHRINHDLNEMQDIINALLDFARLDMSETEIKKQPVDIQPLLNDCVNAQWIDAKKISVQNSIVAKIDCDPKHLKLLLNNLIKNAVLYGRTQILISTARYDDILQIVVEDDGPGISEADLLEIFKPFVRGENTGNQKGHGLGLAIVERVVSWNKWTVSVGRSGTLGGAKFCLTIALT